jgi:hypothetical protein
MRAVFPTSLPGPWCCKALGGAPTAAAASDDDANPCLEEEEENKCTRPTTLSFLNKKLLLPWVLHSPSTHLTIAATTTTQTPNPHTHKQTKHYNFPFATKQALASVDTYLVDQLPTSAGRVFQFVWN